MSTRCIVVGAGVIGAATAMRLAQSGAQVTLLDAADPGSGTSATTFAWVGASPLGLWDYFEINVAGMAAYRRLRAELGVTPWYHAGGALVWYSAADAGGGLAARVEQLRDVGYPATLISQARARTLEPGVRFGAAERVAFYSDEGYAFPRPMIADLLRMARAHGASTRWGARVVGLEELGGAVRVTLRDGDVIEGDTVVLCCGRWSAEVAALAGAEIPMLPFERGSVSVGLLVLTSVITQRVERVLIPDEVMIRPDGAGRLLLHSDEHDRLVDPQDDDLRETADQVVGAAARHLDLAARPTVDLATVGLRALTGDLLPAVGRLPGSGRVYAAVTHSGITLAPLLGELISAEILTDVEEPLLARFRPGRFLATASNPIEERS